MSRLAIPLAAGVLLAVAITPQFTWAQNDPAATVGTIQRHAGVRVLGDVPDPFTLTLEIARGMERVTVSASEHGRPAVTYEGVRLADVLARAGLPLGDSLRGRRLAQFVVVEASDGYRAVYSMAELDRRFSGRDVVLVDRREGEALDDAQGPFRVVIPGDPWPSRWIRQVTSIRVQSPAPY
jgi:hypothetical protein